jgi:hypothetical protein
MIDQLEEFAVGHRTVEFDRVPVPLVQMVARGDRRILATQECRAVRVAFEAHVAGDPAQRHQREHLSADLKYRHLVAKRVVFDDAGFREALGDHTVSQ